MVTQIQVEQVPVAEKNAVVEKARQVILIGLGAFGMAQDNVSKWSTSLIERGEQVTRNGRGQVQDAVDQRKQEAQKARKNAEKGMEKRVETVLHRLNIPTHNDIKSLNSKLTTLSRKVDELKKAAA